MLNTFCPGRGSNREPLTSEANTLLNTFSYLDPFRLMSVNVHMTSLLKLEITVSFLAFIASSFRVTEED